MATNKLKETITEKALFYLNVEGWNCAESVYMAIFKEYYKMDVTPKTVTAFGGGIARTGGVCGAVNVAIMGVSQKYGRTNPKQPFVKTQRPVFQFLNQIVDEYGTIQCNHLKKTQLTTTLENTDKSEDENLCTPLIKKIIQAFLQTVENTKTIVE